MIISDLKTVPRSGSVKGACAHCNAEVYENIWLLDDAYNVWMGRCPACKALNYLSMNHGLRGYSRAQMHLVLPTAEEIAANGLPADTPSSGVSGKPADCHGSVAGEIMHRLSEGLPLTSEVSK
jgi:hypothetical protein